MESDIYKNKTILVTGAASRTGNAIARYLLTKNARVFLNYRSDLEGVERIVRDFSGKLALPVRGDVSHEPDVVRLVEHVGSAAPALDGLINVVGEYFEAPVMQTPFSKWKEMIDNNLNSTFLMCRYFHPLLQRSDNGRVVNFAYSNADRIVASRVLPYHIAKMGVISLSKTLAKEWGKDGISINVISPGTLFNSITKASKDPEDYIPQQRFGQYEDLWPILDMIFRPDSTYLTGNNFVLSGGYNL
ncbi:MAG: SDR family oxidoreductase [Proteobacteria bacterium]|nr:SDR family oxidoreductase [Pseudomonadota bacterium]